MDRVFSVDENSEQFWVSPPSSSREASQMNRSASEWAFQRFLQESSSPPSSSVSAAAAAAASAENDVVELKVPVDEPKQTPPPIASLDPPPNVPIDSQEYQAFLKSRLNLACAAVALSRVIFLFLLF